MYERACSHPAQEDKPLHIIDQLYSHLKKFDGLRFIDPNYLAAIKPFNILDEHVWHYEKRNLFTINPAIFHLLKEINLEDTEVSFSDSLQKQIKEAGVIEAKSKVISVFQILNQCFVHEISAVKDYQAIMTRNKNTIGFSHRVHFSFKEGEEGVTKNIMVIKDEQCDCLICNYRNFDFNRLLTKLKVAEGNDAYNTPEYAFGNYLAATDNFKATYNKVKVIENESKGKQGKGVSYFLAKHNLLLLHNLVSDYNLDDRKEILRYIRGIDLDKVVYEEIEFDVDKEVRSYLLKIKEGDLIYKLQEEINDAVDDIENLKLRYENGGGQMAGPNLWHDLLDHYFLLYLYVNLNFVVYDNFKRYRTLAQKVFQGFVWSHQTPQWGVPSFNSFMLTEALLFIPRDKLQEILKDVNELKTDEKSLEEMLRKLSNLTSSYYEDTLFGDPVENIVIKTQLNNYRFKDNFTNIFTNLFTVLSRLDISKEKFQKHKQPLFKFLKIERELHWYDLREFFVFVRRKAHLFEAAELEELLSIAINRDKYGFNKYSDMIQQIPKALLNAHPGYKIAKTKLISTALLNSSSETGDHENYMHLIDLTNVCNEECQQLLYTAFEKLLDNEFNADFYEKLLLKTTYDFNRKGYFKQYTEYVNLHKGGRTYKFGKSELTDLRFYNYINLTYQRRIEFNYPELKLFTGLNSFETWLLNPFDFNYADFDAKWLHDLFNTVVIERLQGNKDIAAALDKELEACFDPVLAELKYKYFRVLNN